MLNVRQNTGLVTSILAVQLLNASFGQEAQNDNEVLAPVVQTLDHDSASLLMPEQADRQVEQEPAITNEQLIEMRAKLLKAFDKDENHAQSQTTLRPLSLELLSLFTRELFESKVTFCKVATSTEYNEIQFKFTYNPRCAELFQQECEVVGFTQLADSSYDLIKAPHFKDFKIVSWFFSDIFLEDTYRRIAMDKIESDDRDITNAKLKAEYDKTIVGRFSKFIDDSPRFVGLIQVLIGAGAISFLSHLYSRRQSKKAIKIIDQKNKERAGREAEKLKIGHEKSTLDSEKALNHSKLEQTQSLSSPENKLAQEGTGRFNYLLKGNNQQTIEFILQPGEQLIAEQGSMLYRESAVKMYTISGSDIGFSSGAKGIVKRLLSGESFFFVNFTNESDKPAKVNLSPESIGTLMHFELRKYPAGLFATNGAFFAADKDTKMNVLKKNSLKGFLSGRGIFQQHFSGHGNLITFCPGKLEKIELAEGSDLITDTKCLFAWTNNEAVEFKSQSLKEAATNGEGLFVCKVKGPNTIWISSCKNTNSTPGVSNTIDMFT